MNLDLDNKEFQGAIDLVQETSNSFFITGMMIRLTMHLKET